MSTDDEFDLDRSLSSRLHDYGANYNGIRNMKDSSKEMRQSSSKSRKKGKARASVRNGACGASADPRFNSWIVPETPSPYQLGNKKRQNGDKHEQVAKSKRTCLSDQFLQCDAANGFKMNGFVENYPICKDFDQRRVMKDAVFHNTVIPAEYKENHMSYVEREISPDRTYENFSKNGMPVSDENDSNSRVSSSTFSSNQMVFSSKSSPDHSVMYKNNVSEPSTSRSGQECIDSDDMSHSQYSCRAKALRRGVQFIDSNSDSDEESEILIKPVAFRGRRQFPDCLNSPKRIIGKGPMRIFDSDDSTESNWQTMYRSRPVTFSSSDSDDFNDENRKQTFGKRPINKLSSTDSNDGSLSSPVTVSPLSATSTVTQNKNSSSATVADFLEDFEKSCTSVQASESNSSNITPGIVPCQSISNSPSRFRNRIANHESFYHRSGSPHPRAIRNRRSNGMSRFSILPLNVNARTVACHDDLLARFPNIFDPEDSSEVEFFTANSCSDTETSAESVNGIHANGISHVNYINGQSRTRDPSVVIGGSSDDEVSVIFSSNSPHGDASNRRRAPRGAGLLWHSRTPCHASITNSHEIISLSPDPVEQVKQMEEDEKYAKLLQAQYDAELHEQQQRQQQPRSASLSDLIAGRNNDDEIIDSGLELNIRSLPHVEMNHSMMHSPIEASPFPQYSHIRGRSRFRRASNVLLLAGARRRLGRRRFHGFHTDPWMWQFARILGLGPTDHSSERDEGDYNALIELAESVGEVGPRGLHKTDINRLPTRKFVCPTRGSSSNQGFDDVIHNRTELNKECQVCLCDYENGDVLRILPCFHEFHTPCIDPWLKINHTCPVCRVQVNLED